MHRKRKTIAVLINNLDTEYQLTIWQGVEKAAAELDIDVFFIGSGAIGSPYENDKRRNTVHQFLTPNSIDGIIVVSTTVAGHIGSEALAAYLLGLYPGIPIVSIGAPDIVFPSVTVDNRSGIREAVTHLVEVHGRKKFVFLSGNPKNVDSQEREQALIETLSGYGLAVVQDGIVQGRFMYHPVLKIFGEWLERGIEFDAVVSANDEMAFACYEVLRKKGIRVPQDVSICGFDDSANAHFFHVPLTSVKQPVIEFSIEAVKKLLRIIGGEEKPESSVFPTSLVIRESCGCSSREVIGYSTGIAAATDCVCEQLSAAFAKLISGEYEPEAFMDNFQLCIDKAPAEGKTWYELGMQVSRYEAELWKVDRDRETLRRCESALHQARVNLKQRAESFQANLRISNAQLERNKQYSIAHLISTFSVDGLFDRLAGTLPGIGIESCFLSLFVPDSGYAKSTLKVAFHKGVRFDLPQEGVEFESKYFFPAEFLQFTERFNFYVEMLFHEEYLMGFLIIRIDPSAGIISDSLTNQIRSALRSSLLVEELLEKDKKLNEAFAQLSERALELERAGERIRLNQAQLVASEKMASLGRLTAGFAHEMNTPLAAVRASLSELTNLVTEYRESLGDAEVSAEDHRAIANEMDQLVQIAVKSSERASTFIRSIKNQTRTAPSGEGGKPFDLGKSVRDSLLLLAHLLREGKCKVDFPDPPCQVDIKGESDKFAQVFTNLITNAIDAMAPEGGVITITLSVLNDKAVLSVADTGCGIEESNLAAIFDPFFTTKVFGAGTGLGLSISRDIISGDFGGTIEVKSSPGKGACFTVRIPLFKETP